MKLFWKIFIGIVAWTALIAYFVWALDLTHRGRDGVAIKTLDVAVSDSTRQSIVSTANLREWIDSTGIDMRNMDIHELNTELIRTTIASKPFIKDVTTYSTLNGRVVVRAWQRYPICRVATSNGYDFYITEDGYVMPSHLASELYLPVVTGVFTPPFAQGYTGIVTMKEKKLEKNYIFLSKLISFVKFIENNEFWSSQIVQINVLEQTPEEMQSSWKEPLVEVIPRVGDFTVLFGELTNIENKFEKLMLMYDNVIGFEGWIGCKVINLRYDNQVVCVN